MMTHFLVEIENFIFKDITVHRLRDIYSLKESVYKNDLIYNKHGFHKICNEYW